LSAFPSPSHRAQATPDVQAGIAAGDFICKPFNPTALLNCVNHWTAQRLTKV
jgi:hypothetical protein